MKVKTYIVVTEKVRFKIVADSIKSAIERTCKLENMPKSAISGVIINKVVTV